MKSKSAKKSSKKEKAAPQPIYQEKVKGLLKEKSTALSIGLFTVFFILAGILVLTNPKRINVAEIEKENREAYMKSLTVTQGASEYIVQEGEGLWEIAEKTTGNGENWVKIAEANGVTNPDTIVAGVKLVIPQGLLAAVVTAAPSPTLVIATVAPSPTVEPTAVPPTSIPTPTGFVENGQIDGGMTKKANPSVKEYVVQEGEGLWQIAEKVYGDGEMWTAIMQENNLQNPEQIETGMKLKMPGIK